MEPPRSTDWAVSGLAQLFDTVLTAAGQSSDLSPTDREQFEEAGSSAFSAGMGLGGLIDSYLGGAAEIWEHVFTSADPSRAVEQSRALRRVSEQAISSLAAGFESAQRQSIRAEESLRRAFFEELLTSAPDAARLAEAAAQLDFPTFDRAVVAVAGSARNFTDAGPVHRRVKTELESRAPQRRLQVTTSNGQIVVIGLDITPGELTALLGKALTAVPEIDWRIGTGASCEALEGIGTAYREALDALRIGHLFDLASPTLYERALPQRLFLADPELTEALVRDVLDPLTRKARSEMLPTLVSFVEHGGNMADVARDLNIGARTVAYRLDRIAELTGYSPREPADRFVLELAYRAMPIVAAQRRRTP